LFRIFTYLQNSHNYKIAKLHYYSNFHVPKNPNFFQNFIQLKNSTINPKIIYSRNSAITQKIHILKTLFSYKFQNFPIFAPSHSSPTFSQNIRKPEQIRLIITHKGWFHNVAINHSRLTQSIIRKRAYATSRISCWFLLTSVFDSRDSRNLGYARILGRRTGCFDFSLISISLSGFCFFLCAKN
jgi:hypothetical protein